MDVVWHAVYLQYFVFIFLKNTGNVLMQPFFTVIADKRCPVFYSKNKLDMNLGITVCHI